MFAGVYLDKDKNQIMKKSIAIAACLFALTLAPVFGQPSPLPTGAYQERLQQITRSASAQANQLEAAPLTKFNLDFPGGTPAELVKAIEKSTGKPLNVIIPTEDAQTQLPPLKMSDVNVQQLFAALERASYKTVAVTQPYSSSYQTVSTGYGFKTDGPLSDSSIWYFHVDKPTLPPVVSTEKVCYFYSLSPYLDRGFTVDDITTAIQTGWKMAGINPVPELNYHKETKMLIAFGEPGKLNTIQRVLETLPASALPRDTIDFMKSQIKDLQNQVAGLKKNISAAAPAAQEEKTGK